MKIFPIRGSFYIGTQNHVSSRVASQSLVQDCKESVTPLSLRLGETSLTNLMSPLNGLLNLDRKGITTKSNPTLQGS